MEGENVTRGLAHHLCQHHAVDPLRRLDAGDRRERRREIDRPHELRVPARLHAVTVEDQRDVRVEVVRRAMRRHDPTEEAERRERDDQLNRRRGGE